MNETLQFDANGKPIHSQAYRIRRFLNWFPMGLTYAFLYMGRYNLTVSKNALGDLMTKEDFGIIFGFGTIVYAFSFLLNGPLVDRIGGRKGILISSLGAAIMNLGMGLYLSWTISTGFATSEKIRFVFTLLYAGNMYFQSYGAVSIVKVNAHWFHVRERGGFSGIFGTMISSGIFFAFTVNGWILDIAARGTTEVAAARWVFFAPSAVLLLFFFIETFMLRDNPESAGFADFDTADASSGEEGKDIPVFQIMKRVITNPIILTVAFIEFCTGVIRNGVMHWFPIYAKEEWSLPNNHFLRYGSWENLWLLGACLLLGILFFYIGYKSRGARRAWSIISGGLIVLIPFIQGGWGGILFVAGVIGANVAGWISDIFFQSRRAPVAGILYGILAVASIGIFFSLSGTYNIVKWTKQPVGNLQENDRITMVGDKKVNSWKEVEEVIGEIANSGPSLSGKVSIPLTIERDGVEKKVEVGLSLKDGNIPSWHILPKHGGYLYDSSAVPIIMALKPGDKIKSLAGAPDELEKRLETGAFKTWKDVSKAVAAIPAKCLGKAKWDPEKCMCSYNGSGVPEGEEISTGLIYFRIVRNGEEFTLALRDPAPEMHAGEKRVLSAGPVLHFSPLWLGLIVFIISVGVIGTHGLLSGTATMDFGGRKGAATAVGMIDGFVYLGTGFQSFSLGYLTTQNWAYWPIFLFPFCVIGFLLLRRIWYAIPEGKKS